MLTFIRGRIHRSRLWEAETHSGWQRTRGWLTDQRRTPPELGLLRDSLPVSPTHPVMKSRWRMEKGWLSATSLGRETAEAQLQGTEGNRWPSPLSGNGNVCPSKSLPNIETDDGNLGWQMMCKQGTKVQDVSNLGKGATRSAVNLKITLNGGNKNFLALVHMLEPANRASEFTAYYATLSIPPDPPLISLCSALNLRFRIDRTHRWSARSLWCQHFQSMPWNRPHLGPLRKRRLHSAALHNPASPTT